MSENVENPILAQLREMRPDLARMEWDMGVVRDGFAAAGARVDGLATLLTPLAGHMQHFDKPVDKLEGQLAR